MKELEERAIRFLAIPVIVAMTLGCAAALPPGQALGATSSCIPLDQVISKRVAGAAAVDFELVGGAVYRNSLASACPGLERLGGSAVVALTSGGEGGRLCRGDRVRVFDATEARATGLQSYAQCLLGDFSRIPTQ